MSAAEGEDRSPEIIAQLQQAPSEEEFSALHDLIREAEKLSDEDSVRLDEIVQQINSTTPLQTDRRYFATLYGWSSAEELAQCWAAPLPACVSDLSDSELLAIIAATNANVATPQIDRFLWFLKSSLGPAFSTDLIFWPYADWTDSELSAEIRKRQNLLAEGGEAALAEYEIGIAHEILRDANSLPPRQYWAQGRLKASSQSPEAM